MKGRFKVKFKGRPRVKDYSKLRVERELQYRRGVYLIVNDRLNYKYVGKSDESLAIRYSKRMDEYMRDSKTCKTCKTCSEPSRVLFGESDSYMTWVYVHDENNYPITVKFIEDRMIQLFDYDYDIANKRISKREIRPVIEYGLMNVDKLVELGIMKQVA